MIAIANKNLEQAGVLADLRVDDGQELSTVDDASVDAVVSNYVLMDLPDHEAALHAISRVLMPGGVAVLVFLHPCFDTPEGPTRGDDGVSYHWPRPYVERWSFDCRWGSFDTAFHTFHRSLSDYWRAFSDANLNVTAFEEPVVPSDHPELTADVTARARWTPFSVAFKLSKPAAR
jgi:ubiquinone/menaquinone biosynthesis C-methylase UbiE